MLWASKVWLQNQKAQWEGGKNFQKWAGTMLTLASYKLKFDTYLVIMAKNTLSMWFVYIVRTDDMA